MKILINVKRHGKHLDMNWESKAKKREETIHKNSNNLSFPSEVSNTFPDYFSNTAPDEIQSVCLQFIPTLYFI